jgi:RND family efflux transporter MFP subunit
LKAAIGGLALAALVGCKDENKFVPPPPPKVSVAQPLQKKITYYLETTGSTQPFNIVDLAARVQGFLQEISYKDGATVKVGDTLFTIEPPPYLAKLHQAQAELEGAQARLLQAEAEYSRQSQLAKADFASQSVLDQARAKRDSNLANVDQDKANVEEAAIQYGYTRVMAPFSGVVSAHLVSVGQLVGGTQPTKLATILQLQPIYVTFSISEQDVLRIRAALKESGKTLADLGTIPVEVGLQTEQGYPHAGVLDYAAPNVDQATGTLGARGIFENADLALLPGYFVRVRMPTARDQEVLLVPETALGSDQGGQYLLVVNADNVVEQRHVQTGPAEGDLRSIQNGLKPEDRVIVAGLQRAAPGEKVDPQIHTADAGPAAH